MRVSLQTSEKGSLGPNAAGFEVTKQFPAHSPQLPTKRQVQNFWERAPCDSWFTDEPPGTPAFYRNLDEHRYRIHPHLVSAVGFERTAGLRVLEVGCGCGSEAERFARAGAHYTGVDLTNAAVSITRQRFRLAGLEGHFIQGDAENLPFADDTFDLVYSHGVLHHTPDTSRAIREVHRVLSPGGRAAVMVYYRDSFNYYVNLRLIRRFRARLLKTERGIKIAGWIFKESEKNLRRHAVLIQHNPRLYTDSQQLLNRNTDGPDNPLSQVFSKESAKWMFRQFANVNTKIMFWNPNWLPAVGKVLPRSIEDWLMSKWGWHLWIYAQKSLLDFALPSEALHPEQLGINLQVSSEAALR